MQFMSFKKYYRKQILQPHLNLHLLVPPYKSSLYPYKDLSEKCPNFLEMINIPLKEKQY